MMSDLDLRKEFDSLFCGRCDHTLAQHNDYECYGGRIGCRCSLSKFDLTGLETIKLFRKISDTPDRLDRKG
jgi:hypothetical protein